MAYQSVHSGPAIDAAVTQLADIQIVRDESNANLATVQNLAAQVATDAGTASTAAASATQTLNDATAAIAAADHARQEQIDAEIAIVADQRLAAEQAATEAVAAAGAAVVTVTQDMAASVPTPNKLPLADAQGKIASDWLGADIARAADVVRTDALAAPAGAGLVGFQQSGAGAVARTMQDKAREWVSVKDFGAVGDGVADDTVAAHAAHAYANSVGAPVSYNGIQKIGLQANAQIPVKTSVDFESCEVVIIGGVVEEPSWNSFNTVFVVSDDACPLQTVTGAVSASNLGVGSLFPTAGLFDGHGYAKIACDLQVPNREKTGTQSYTQAFKVNRNGKVSLPLSANISAHAAAITVDYRKTSLKRLLIKNVSLLEGAWNNQRVFRIERCNVHIDGFTLLYTGGATKNICEIISIADSSDVTVDNYVTTGRATTGGASYSLAINGGADIRINGMNALEGWGCFGCNDLNGLYVTNSIINRIDTHGSGHNIFVHNCDVHQFGIMYGWGGGILSVKNSRFYRCNPIKSRDDWGGTFFGSIIVDSIEVSDNFSAALTIVDLATNPLGASAGVYSPESIEVSNVKRVGAARSNGGEIIAAAIKVAAPSSVVYAPSRIDVRNIGCSFSMWRFGLRIDSLNMEGYPGTLVTRILIDGVYPDMAASSSSNIPTSGILDYDAIRTPASYARPNIKVSNAENIAIRCRSADFVDIRAINAGLNAISVDTAAAKKQAVIVDACRFLSLAVGATAAVIGASNSGTDRYTVIRDCEIAAAAFDFSSVAAMSGNTIRAGATQPSLPAGCTPALAFTGWQGASVFS